MRKRAIIILVCSLFVIIAGTSLWYYLRHNTIFSADIERNDAIEVTPELIRSIKDIGQWEFLSVKEEELVDTVRKGIFSDDHLVRIYQGTLSIGVDLQQIKDHNIFFQSDTLHVILPPIQLLDENFIDEAGSRSFHESGRWSPAAREALYQKAKRQMMAHALTPRNYQSAQEYGEVQVRKMLQNMGFNHTVVSFSNGK